MKGKGRKEIRMPSIIGHTFRIAIGISILALLLVVTAQAQVIIPYLDTGYKYKIVAFDESAGFESPSFDDSGFSVGNAGFGDRYGCSPGTDANTNWPLNTDILLRKEFNLPSGAANLKVGVAIDNDIQVFINGHDISGGLIVHEGCATRDNLVFTVPDNTLKTGSNLIAVRARDRGGSLSYVDIQVTGDVVTPTPTPTVTPTPSPSPTPTPTPTPSPTPTPIPCSGILSVSQSSCNSITVISPNGGEKWQIGSTQVIQWTYTGDLSSVKIELLKSLTSKPVATIEPQASIGSNGKGSYLWLVKPPFGVRYTPGAYFIRIIGNDGSAADISDVHFELTSPPANQPPEKPSKLGQFKSDGKTSITTGDITNERTVVFKGTVSDPGKDKVKLQIELRRLDEYGGQFDETKGGLKESDLVPSGRQVTITVNDLIDDKYHWRARAIDANGNIGDWQEFGNNDISAADFVIVGPSSLPIPADSHRIRVLNENQQPLEGATIRVSYAGIYGLPLAKADDSLATTNEEGVVDIFFKDQKEKNNIVIHVRRLINKKDGKEGRPWNTCIKQAIYGSVILWECQLPVSGPQIMATRSTNIDANADKESGTPAYTRIGWTTTKNDPRCERTDGTGTWCYTDKKPLDLRNDFRSNLNTILEPFRIDRYQADSIDDLTALGYLKDAAIEYSKDEIPVPLPVLEAIMSGEGECRWTISGSCGNAHWDDGWTKITFDGGIGAMQLTGGTALARATDKTINVLPDKGIDSLSASFKNNIRASANFFNTNFIGENRNIISNWEEAIKSYNPGKPTYLGDTKAKYVPFYAPDPKVERYIEDDSFQKDRTSYVQLDKLWKTTCGIEDVDGKNLWVCQEVKKGGNK